MHIKNLLLSGLLCFGAFIQNAQAGSEPGQKALGEVQSMVQAPREAVQNRFFLKETRFEFSPIIGLVPNNPMVSRFTGGLLVAYHFSESLAAEGAFIYSPDLGLADIKGLTTTLVQIAHSGSADLDFQQPLDKMELGATFAARWAPVYGKISLVGEGVLNFDIYGVAGLGMLSTNLYYAQYDAVNVVALVPAGRKIRIPVNLGFGLNVFINQTVALKIDARSYLYQGLKPQYDPDIPVNESRLYNTFVTSMGASVFFPKMKPRMDY
ncbi:MAG: outer membrane beta-barrel domain-containing protein [Myxococcota bacterium]|nr:outer membrane beta-barrel domain-containing protein [Myxococcota bacterium]